MDQITKSFFSCVTARGVVMPIVDADAHVIEGDHTWSFMLEEERHLAPEKLISQKTGIEFWRFEDRVLANSNLGLNVPVESRDMTDVTERLKHMDALGIDVQVLYPTLFLRPTTARTDVELAIYRGYNRWLAHIWRLGNNRLRWVVLPPLHSLNEAIDEINFGKEHGACGSSCAAMRNVACCLTPHCFLCTKKPSGWICRSAFTPAPAISATTINLVKMSFRALNYPLSALLIT